jgi:NADPH-dependent 2,4-dienoyl-CoA reductase/sulfur reductase-like enzyme
MGTQQYKYIIVGGGMTADAAVTGIRTMDPLGSIALISEAPVPPYNRPPLSKGLWTGMYTDAIWRGTPAYLVDLYLGRKVVGLDPDARQVTDDRGDVYEYEKLLLATGCSPRRMNFGGDAITYFRTLEDYKRLRRQTELGGKFAVIGSGFIGSEIAASLRMNRQDVTMLYPGEGIGGRVLPAELAEFIVDYFKRKGVTMIGNERVNAMEPAGTGVILRAESGLEVQADHVVAGIGVIPNIELAEQAGLETGNGIVVDQHLRTARPEILAAGDVAAFYSPLFEKHWRIEHEDNSNHMGKTAGMNMAGADEPYDHLPYFDSEVFDLRYEAVGSLDSRLETVIDWRKPFEQGVVYYLGDGRVKGVLTWNLPFKIGAARKLIMDEGPFDSANVVGRI